ncbi:GntR family transcriptional regulator [Erysipelothrix urinaevulpis]|uniref:GntR family transcriptional regulator n=1 Tax=Erysipelothrix urinaevulpis TaxID=2683717 RepID=UPI00135BC652|nr:GntR family transcriptional regulator [Erysipelothrix urinaevulpis]
MLQKQSSVAVYRQIIDYFEHEIASGRMIAGQRIESIRSLAVSFKVNPNTVQKALNELERDQLIFTDRTNGKFVTEDEEMIVKLRDKLGHDIGKIVLQQATMLGLSFSETMTLIQDVWEETNHE